MGKRDPASRSSFQKKPYEKPALERLGTLTDLTQNKGSSSPTGDGGSKGSTKTH